MPDSFIRTAPDGRSPGGDSGGTAKLPDIHAYAAARQALIVRTLPIIITTIVLVVVAFADVSLAVPAFNAVLRGSPLVSFICGAAFISVAIAASFTAGRELRHGDRRVLYAAATAVLLLITGLLVLRITAAGINSSATAFEGGAQQQDGALAEVPTALVFTALMLATSILATVDGYLLTVPRIVTTLRTVAAESARIDSALAEREGEHIRLAENVAISEGRIESLDAEEQEALDGLEAFARELQEIARMEIARHTRNPKTTSGLDIPTTNPATLDTKAPHHAS